MKTNRSAYIKGKKAATLEDINNAVGGMTETIADIDEAVQEAVAAAETAQSNAGTALGDISAHKSSTANPHGVTATQIGLGNVDDTPDDSKPLSAVQKAYVDGVVVGMYRTKGSREFAELPTSRQVIGDVYNILDNFTLNGKSYSAGTNVVWAGSEWDPLAPDILGVSTALNRDFSLMPPVTSLSDANILVLQAGATNCSIAWLDLKKQIVDTQYPIGKIEEWGDSADPNVLYPWQTWARYGAGRVAVGYNSADADFDDIGATGGSKTHTLTANELPKQSKTGTITVSTTQYTANGSPQPVDSPVGTDRYAVDYTKESSSSLEPNKYTGGTGFGGAWQKQLTAEHGLPLGDEQPHNNMQPYIVVGRWIRVS